MFIIFQKRVINLICRIVDMKNKEVISIKDGCKIGCVNDVEVDMKCAKIVAIVVYGRLKCCGLLGREEDIIIKWENIEAPLPQCKKRHRLKATKAGSVKGNQMQISL